MVSVTSNAGTIQRHTEAVLHHRIRFLTHHSHAFFKLQPCVIASQPKWAEQIPGSPGGDPLVPLRRPQDLRLRHQTEHKQSIVSLRCIRGAQ